MSRPVPARIAALLVALAAVALAGCYSTGIKQLGERSMTVSGTVTCRERLYTPVPGALVVVELIDPTNDDQFPVIIAQQTIAADNLVQVPFTLELSPALIDPNHDYAVRARVVSPASGDAGVLFHTAQPVPVITRGRPHHVALELVSGAKGTPPPAATGATPITTP